MNPFRRRIPYVEQNTAVECGLACLAMVLRYHGRPASLDEVRELLPTNRAGTSAQELLEAAQALGLAGKGISVELEHLPVLPRGTILHWEMGHFVVLEGMSGASAHVVDPAMGRRLVPPDELRRALTGVALLLEPGEGFSRRGRASNGAARYVWAKIRSAGVLGKLLAMSLLLQASSLFAPALSVLVLDRVLPASDDRLLRVLIAGISILTFFTVASALIRQHLLIDLRVRVTEGLRLELMERLLKLPFSYFQVRGTGDLLQRLTSAAMVQQLLSSAAVTVALDFLLLGVYGAALVAVSPLLAVEAGAIAAVQILLVTLTLERRGNLYGEEAALDGRTLSAASELISGIETLKASGREQAALRAWSLKFTRFLHSTLARERYEIATGVLPRALQFAGPLLVLAHGASLVLAGSLSEGRMLGVYVLAVGLLAPVSSLATSAADYVYLRTHLQRLGDVFNAAPEQDPAAARPPPARLQGRVTLRNVTLRYSPGAPPAVDGVSLEVQPGQFVAIVGPSGAGKTSLAHLLIGLSLPSEGTVEIDGLDVRGLELTALRRQFGVVTQRPHLFAQTVRENISGGDPSLSLERIEAAARLACVHDEILALPAGYDTPLAEGGSSISGGQAQRIALARALAHGPRILLLDESTSALDAVTERAVQENLKKLQCTRVVIAHRLSTVQQADVIHVLHGGRLLESGDHPELLRRNGAYAALMSAQLRAVQS